MNDKRDFDRAVDQWLDQGSDATPPEVIDAVLLAVRSTPQERDFRVLWRTTPMTPYLRVAAVIALAAIASSAALSAFGLGGSGFGGTNATPSPSPTLLARGDFVIADTFYAVELEATGEGSSVTGRMIVSEHPAVREDLPPEAYVYTVDLQCTQTTDEGSIMIGGITTEGNVVSPEGAWAGIVFEPGSPVKARLLHQAGGPGSNATSCLGYLDEHARGEGGYRRPFLPIEGTIELRGSGPGQPTTAPSPSPALLAQGTFKAKGAGVELNATGDGDDVTGTMTVSDESGETLFAVDLMCALTAEDGRILIAGDTTESAAWATMGTYTAIVLKPGSTVHAAFGFEEDASSAASCVTFLEGIIDAPFATAIGDGALEPIEGTVELRP